MKHPPQVTFAAFLLGLALLATQAALPRAAEAAEVEWKMNIPWTDNRDEAPTFRRWADAINARTKGKLKVTVYTGGVLGVKDVDMLRALPPGNVIQVAGLFPGYVSRDVPDLANVLPTGVLKGADDILALLPTIREIYQPTLEKKWGLKYLGLVIPQNRTYHIFCKEPIRSLAALKGIKLRVFEKSLVDTFGELGVSAQVIPQYEMYVALQTGVVNCAFYGTAFATTISLQEVTPYAAFITPYASAPYAVIASKAAFDKLPADVQTVIIDETKKLEAREIERFKKADWDNGELIKLNMRGGILLPPYSQADRDAFTAASRVAWKKLSEAGGPSSKQNYEIMIKALGGN